MQDLEPCPKGITKNGFTLDLTPSFLIQRSGINSNGLAKFFSNRHETKFCVTTIVWKYNHEGLNIKINSINSTHIFWYVIASKNHIFVQYSANAN